MSRRDVVTQAAVLVRAWEAGYFEAFRERWGWGDASWQRLVGGPAPRTDLGGTNARRREAWALAFELLGESPRKGLSEELRRGYGLTGDEVVLWFGLPPVRHWGRP